MTEGQITILGSIDEVGVIILYPLQMTEYTALQTARISIKDELERRERDQRVLYEVHAQTARISIKEEQA